MCFVCCRVPILAWFDAAEPPATQQDASAAAGSLLGDGDDGAELYEPDWQQQEEADQQQHDYYTEEGELLSLSGGWLMCGLPCLLCRAVLCCRAAAPHFLCWCTPRAAWCTALFYTASTNTHDNAMFVH